MPALISEIHDHESERVLNLVSLISNNGFLPTAQPLKRLPDTYYEECEILLDDLPDLIRNRTIRHRIDSLSLLTTDRLYTEREWQRAYVIMCFLSHAYIWGGDAPSEVLPPSITVPFLRISDHLKLPPVATYAALNLWNFSNSTTSRVDGKSECGDLTDLDSLEALHTFSGTEDESWFYVLSVAVEARGARTIPQLLRAMEAVAEEEAECETVVIGALQALATCIDELTRLLDRMSERCDPMVFYHRIRPFLAGTKNMAAAGLPNGVFYNEGDGVGRWRQFRGGSNGQSSLIQFFDVFLGIDHSSSSTLSTKKDEQARPKRCSGEVPVKSTTHGELSFHEEVRLYMPAPHREFLASAARKSKVREYVHTTQESSPYYRQLRVAYQDATRAFGDFRQAHMQMVTRYIIVPSRKPAPSLSSFLSSSTKNLATASLRSSISDGGGVTGLTGTGGTDLIPFLKTTRDRTYEPGLLLMAPSLNASSIAETHTGAGGVAHNEGERLEAERI